MKWGTGVRILDMFFPKWENSWKQIIPHYYFSLSPWERLGICMHCLLCCLIEDIEIRLKNLFLYLFIWFQARYSSCITFIKHNLLQTVRYIVHSTVFSRLRGCVCFRSRMLVFDLSAFLKRRLSRDISILQFW